MSVLIRGIKRPTSEEKCKFFQPAPFRAPFCVINGVCHGIDACPLIEVPTPHGDLIDRIALLNHMTNVHKEWQEHPDQHKSIITIIDDELIVNCFPALIEEEIG